MKTAEPGATPAASVMMCAYNRLGYLKGALRSVCSQTFEDFEIVLVDDGSTDGTGDWIRRRSDPRLRYVRLPRNGGPAAARNRVLDEARGEFIALLDSDDLFYPRFLETALRRFRRPGVMVVAANYDVIDGRGRVLSRSEVRPARTRDPLFRIVSGLGYFPPTSGCIIRREVFSRVGGFDAGFRRVCDDVDFWYRTALEFGPAAFCFLDRPLFAYRRHPSQSSFIASLDDWRSLSPRQKEGVFDVARLHRKHSAWQNLVWPA